jgi:deoxyribonuclease V
MNKNILNHSWNVTPQEARNIQKMIAPLAIQEDHLPENIRFVAGIDAHYNEQTKKQTTVIVVIDITSFEIIDEAFYTTEISFPYISGLFSFRELPSVLTVLDQLKQKPDLIICDGQGIAHPRLCGIATHLGVLTNIPTIGCGKTRLIGTYTEPHKIRGSQSPLFLKGSIVGSVLCTRNKCKPLFISVGHCVSLETACAWILKLAPRYRLPEVIRQAHTKAALYAKAIL